MTRREALDAMTAARQTFGMFSPEAAEAEIKVFEVEREYWKAQRDARDTISRAFQD